MARSENTKTPLCRFAFTRGLFEMQTMQNGNKQWNVSLLFPKSADLSELKKLAADTAIAEWGEKAGQMMKDGLIHNPFLDGDGPQGKNKSTGAEHQGFPGHIFIRCQSGADYRPKVFNKQLLPASKEELYSGSYGYAVVNVFTWENKEKGKGLSFGISMAQVTKDGEDLGGGGGGGDPTKFFEKVADEGEAPAAVKSGAGASGFFG